MGLDTVEVIMRIEEAFDITIPDEDAEKIQTIGDAERYLINRIQVEGDSAPCLSSATFYRLRRALMEVCGVDRDCIRTSTRVEDLIPEDVRRTQWHRLGAALGLSLPELHRPVTVIVPLVPVHIGLMVVGWSLLSANPLGPWLAAAVFLALCLAVIDLSFRFLRWTEPYAVMVGSDCETVRRMVVTIINRNYERLVPRERPWRRAEVREVIRSIIRDQYDVHPSELTDDTRFIDL
jgi:hypothetical protein